MFNPFLIIKYLINFITNKFNKLLNINPKKVFEFYIYCLYKLVLYIKITFLWMLIAQHAVSITFNSKKLLKMFQQQKAKLITLKVLPYNATFDDIIQ